MKCVLDWVLELHVAWILELDINQNYIQMTKYQPPVSTWRQLFHK